MIELAIFRHQLFKISEPFIEQQAGQLTNFSPLYLGKARFGPLPKKGDSLALEDLPGQQGLPSRLWQVVTRDPRPYIRLLGHRHPPLIHAHFGVEGVYALPLAKQLGVPLVTTFHGFDATTSRKALFCSRIPSWINYARFRHQLAQQGELFLCVSKFIRDRVLELGFPRDRTHVHYIGIDTEAVRPRESREEMPLVLHVARLVEKKGTAYLIRAFAKISPKFPEAELVIVGDGPLRASLEALARSLHVEGRIRFLGSQSHAQVLEMMRKAACMVLPSINARTGDAEGLPMVLYEAAATGIPLVGTRHGGIPELIIDGKTGFLVAQRSVNELAVRVEELLADKNIRAYLGAEARISVQTHFDIKRQNAKLEEFYNSLLFR
jgi:colanic acid/amylovoran biosynthesis glycosyltransferase